MSFNFVHSIGKDVIHVPRIIEKGGFKCPPYWLISLPYISNKFNFYNLTDRDISCRTVMDNGGFSGKTGAVFVGDMKPEELVRTLHCQNPYLGFAPDLPIGGVQERQENSSDRCEIFWEEFKGQTKILNVIHGNLWSNYNYTLNERHSWLDEMDKKSKGRHSGYAVAGVDKGYSPLEQAMMILHPWAMGKSPQNKTLHLLGVGAAERLAFYFYIQKKFFSWMSLDCKTYTVDASRFFNLLFFNRENQELQRYDLGDRKKSKGEKKTKRKFDEKKFVDIETPFASYYFSKFGLSLKELARRKIENNCFKSEKFLQEWIPVHNVWNIQKYIEFLETKWLEEGEEKFEEFLIGKNKDFAEAIDFAKKVRKVGRKNYQKAVEKLEIKLDTSSFGESYFKHYAGYREPYDENWEDCTQVYDFIGEAKKRKHRSICILGTGPGQILAPIKEALKVIPDGCEISSYAFRELSKNEEISKGLKSKIKKMDMREYIQKTRKRFDFIFSTTLEYLEEDKVVGHLRECSKKCSYLFVDCYFQGKDDKPREYYDPWRKITRPYSWWKSRFLKAGFEPTKNKKLWKSKVKKCKF